LPFKSLKIFPEAENVNGLHHCPFSTAITFFAVFSRSWRTAGVAACARVHPIMTALPIPAIEALADTATQEELALTMAKAVARRAVLDWEGVGDETGNIIPVSPEGIDALLEIWPIFEAFQTKYVAKGLILDAEKNVSAPLPNGRSAEASATARPVRGAAPTAPQD
jgi:hypothetical protein